MAALALLERLLTPATAWFVLQGGLAAKIGATATLAAVFTLRSFAQRTLAARREAQLFERVISTLIEGEVLRARVLLRRDARSDLPQAVHYSAITQAQTVPNLLADTAASILLMLVVLTIEPVRLVLSAAALTAVAAAGVVWSRGRLQRAAKRAWAAQEAVILALVDALEGRLEVVAAGRGDAFLDEARARARAWWRASSRVASATLVSGRLPMLAVAAAVVVLVALSSRSRGVLAITLPDLALFASVTPAFAGIAQGLYALTQAEPWLGLVAETLRLSKRPPGGARPVPQLPATVDFARVSFEYGPSGTRRALQDVTFAWDRGRVLALAGTNGSGKSTCLRLLLGLAPPIAGHITIGGVSLSELDIEAWRRGIAFLPQRAYMPPQADLGAAIRFLVPEATDDRILAALDRVGLLASLHRFGDAPLAAPIDALSVGERQRVAIARLLCHDAAVYLLDEPDANLDRAGIALCARLVRELSQGAMVAFAAHTPELIEAADDVLTLERGRGVANLEPDVSALRHGKVDISGGGANSE